jgi:predicted mannosyl-3-phosphoglycerate phosphatase (HAD superfamily)
MLLWRPWTVGDTRWDWDVVAFTAPPDAGRAVQLPVSVFQVENPAAVIVGLAQETTDVAVLEQVDVPLIVRSGHRDPTALLRTFPDAYLTNAVGADGWREAVPGQRTEYE